MVGKAADYAEKSAEGFKYSNPGESEFNYCLSLWLRFNLKVVANNN
ncbi:hypothetical protein MARHY1971 [Marinobacter nauticus ATCC 49840]|jgi:hypothetical protein|nr:hypothetical protein MARHY1971 [Marinobacter nauticus ATCC 49840]